MIMMIELIEKLEALNKEWPCAQYYICIGAAVSIMSEYACQSLKEAGY